MDRLDGKIYMKYPRLITAEMPEMPSNNCRCELKAKSEIMFHLDIGMIFVKLHDSQFYALIVVCTDAWIQPAGTRAGRGA